MAGSNVTAHTPGSFPGRLIWFWRRLKRRTTASMSSGHWRSGVFPTSFGTRRFGTVVSSSRTTTTARGWKSGSATSKARGQVLVSGSCLLRLTAHESAAARKSRTRYFSGPTSAASWRSSTMKTATSTSRGREGPYGSSARATSARSLRQDQSRVRERAVENSLDSFFIDRSRY